MVAIAGKVKAGKSTLLNAMIGEMVAATDAAECTKLVTWYQYAPAPQLTLYPKLGPPRSLPATSRDGRLVVDLDGTRPGTSTGSWSIGRRGDCRPSR